MIVKQFDNQNEWLEARKGSILGSKLGDVYSPRGGRKIGFYQLIADKLSIVEDTDETARDRGHRLEAEAIEKLNEAYKLKLLPCENTIWVSDTNEGIAFSPDGHNKALTVGAEVKCLKPALHLQAIIENKICDMGYKLQAIQAFIVNEKMKTLYFVFYNPSVTSQPLFVIEMKREDCQADIDYYKQYEIETLEDVNYWVEKLAF